jgi:hypothetical protein
LFRTLLYFSIRKQRITLIRSTPLRAYAAKFGTPTRFACLEPELALQHFTVSLHWNRRPEREPMMRWRLSLFSELFAAKQLDGRRAPSPAAVMPKQNCLRRFEVFPVEGGIAKFYRPPSPLICQEP